MMVFSDSKKDLLIAFLISIFVLMVCAGTLTRGVITWGDDSAAYISEGIAIAENRLPEQAKKNYILHPTELPSEADEEGLVYVWGYPLVLSWVYKLAGFDRTSFSSVIWYKIPLLLSLSMLGGVLYLFYRRRFSRPTSAVMSLVLCFSGDLVKNLNILYSDLLFLFLSMLSFLMMEAFCERALLVTSDNISPQKNSSEKVFSKDGSSNKGFSMDGSSCSGPSQNAAPQIVRKDSGPAVNITSHEKMTALMAGILYGAVLWFTKEVRLNGQTVIMTAALGHFLLIMRNSTAVKNSTAAKNRTAVKNGIVMKNGKCLPAKRQWIHVLPYILMAVLVILSERFILMPPTSNMSVVMGASPDTIMRNIQAYSNVLYGYFSKLPGTNSGIAGALLVAASITGILKKGIFENTHLTVLIIGTLFVNCTMTYNQGIRYFYNILPLLIMFAAYGLQAFWTWFCKKAKPSARFKKCAMAVSIILFLALPLYKTVSSGINNLRNWGQVRSNDVYSPYAVDMYQYIREKLPEDCMIVFGKPRFLYLNTERMSIRTGYNGHTFAQADYYLEYNTDKPEFSEKKKEAESVSKTEVYGNRFYTLYKLEK